MATRLKLQYLGVEWKAREERNGVERLKRRATGAENTKEAEACGGVPGRSKRQGAMSVRRRERPSEAARVRYKKKERDRQRRRRNCWRVRWNAIGRRKIDGNKLRS